MNTVPASEYAKMVGRKRGRIKRSAPERRTYKGRTYDSIPEAKRAQALDMDPEVRLVVPQPTVQLGEDFTYRPDFLVLDCYGCGWWFEDVKGHENDRWPTIKRLWSKYGKAPLIVLDAKTLRERERIEPAKP